MLERLGCRAILLCCLVPASLLAGVREDLAEVARDPYLSKLEAGIYVASLGRVPSDRIVLLEAGSREPRLPASNLKLLTTSAALQKLGADFRFRTLLAVREVNGHTDLAIVGDGDPSLGDLTLYRRLGNGTVTSIFEQWGDALSAGGVRSAERLLIDDSVFDQQFFHPSWPRDQELQSYEAQVGGINLNANCVWIDLRPNAGAAPTVTVTPAGNAVSVENLATTGAKNAAYFTRESGTNKIVLRGECSVPLSEQKVTVHDPALFAGSVLLDALRSKGLSISAAERSTGVRADVLATRGGWRLLAVHETPLGAVIARTNKDSMNLYAEALCKRTGFASSGTGSWESGRAAVGEYLTSIGVEPGSFTLDDGCGLSRKNRVTAELIGKVLEDNFYSRGRELFFSSLAVGGMDGTLDDRFTDDLRGRVFAKSGYINGVSALSGYLQARDGNWFAFSILLNKVPSGTNTAAKRWQEKLIRTLDTAVAKVAQ